MLAGDVLYSFSPVRGDGPEHYPISYHEFHTYFPGDSESWLRSAAYTGSGPHVQPALADFLSGYGRDFYVPGPLLAAGLALGVAGMAGIGRARRSGLRAPCLLFTLGTIAVVEPPFIIATFDWRYELPQLSLIPIAAILGVTALAGWARNPTTSSASADRLARTGRPANDDQPVEEQLTVRVAGASEAGQNERQHPRDRAADLRSAIPGRDASTPGTAARGNPHDDDSVDVSG